MRQSKSLPTMAIMLLTMLFTGVSVGLVFPFFAKMFVVIRPGRTLLFFVSCLIAGLMLGTANYFIARSVLYTPVRKMTEKVKELSSGNLSVKIGVNGEDIIGQLSHSIEALAENFARLVRDARAAAGEVERIGQRVREATMASGEASSRVMDLSSEHSENAKQQLASLDEVNRVMAQMQDWLGRTADRVKAAVLAASEFAETANLGRNLTEQLNEGMRNIDQEVRKAQANVVKLDTNSQTINGIVQLIKGISAQTNLLALNAAIEAARAGQAGSGFMVVAAEVKKLSEASAAAARQISGLVEVMQADVGATVKSFQECVSALQKEDIAMQEAQAVFAQVAATSDELKQGMEVAGAGIEAALKGAESVQGAMSLLDRLSRNSSDCVVQVGAMVSDQVAGLQRLEEQTKALNSAAGYMNRHLEQIRT